MVLGGGVGQGEIQGPHGFAVCRVVDPPPTLVETREVPRFHMAALSAPDLRRCPIELLIAWPETVKRHEYNVVDFFQSGGHRVGDRTATGMANHVDRVRFVFLDV